MPSSGRMALGLLFLTGCAARHFSRVFIRPRTARGGSPKRQKPSALRESVTYRQRYRGVLGTLPSTGSNLPGFRTNQAGMTTP